MRLVSMIVAPTASALLIAGTAAGQDAHERSAGTSGHAAVAGYVDSEGRSDVAAKKVSPSTVSSLGDEFDWSAAAIGASSALMLAVLLTGTFAVTRNMRSRPRAR